MSKRHNRHQRRKNRRANFSRFQNRNPKQGHRQSRAQKKANARPTTVAVVNIQPTRSRGFRPLTAMLIGLAIGVMLTMFYYRFTTQPGLVDKVAAGPALWTFQYQASKPLTKENDYEFGQTIKALPTDPRTRSLVESQLANYAMSSPLFSTQYHAEKKLWEMRRSTLGQHQVDPMLLTADSNGRHRLLLPDKQIKGTWAKSGFGAKISREQNSVHSILAQLASLWSLLFSAMESGTSSSMRKPNSPFMLITNIARLI